jgi:hypothetical protein
MVDAARRVMLDGAGLTEIAPEVGLLLAFGFLLLAVAARAFRWQ